MRLSSAGTRRSSQSSSTSLRFLNATKSSHLMEEGDCVSENSHPRLQLKIPHMTNRHHHQHSTKSSFPQKQNRRRRSSSPATISTTARKTVQSSSSIMMQEDEDAAMLQYLNHQRKKSDMPETWSVKLPAYHHSMQQQPAATKSKSRKSYPPPNSMFRGNASGVSPAAMNSFGAVEDEEEWLAERREPFATIEEFNEKRKWKRWFLN